MKQTLAAWLMIVCLICPAAAAEVSQKDMTVMVYLCGSNLESNGGAATKDITEMLRSGYDPERLNVVVMAGGSERWFCGFPADSGNIYLLGKGRPKSVWRGELQNMGQPETLSFFLKYAREHYPAKRYGLILWDHGGGPIGGICADTQFNGDSLSLAELRTALEDAGLSRQRLEFIGFDACLMATLETALAVAPFANYMIASQETEPGDGWNYGFLKNIHKAWRDDIGKRIADYYIEESYSGGSTKTISCIQLSTVEKLERAVSQYFTAIAGELEPDSFARFAQGRSKARSFGSNVKAEQDYDLVDILSLAKQYSGENTLTYKRLMWALNRTVIYRKSTVEDCCGLSLYHPYKNEQIFQRKRNAFLESPYVPIGYKLYVGRFFDCQTGMEGLGDWDLLSTQSISRPLAGYQRFLTRIPPQQREHFRSAQFLVLGRLPDAPDGERWTVVYSSGELQPVESGYLSWWYYEEGLYAVDDETGQSLAGPIWNLRLDSGNTFYTVLRPENTAFAPQSSVGDVLCKFLLNEETGWLELQEALVYDEVLETFTPRQAFSLADYPGVQFPNTVFSPVYREDGTLTAPDQWETAANTQWALELENGGWHLEYRSGNFPDLTLYGCFLIQDVLNQTTMTELRPVTISNASR